ncbi:MAG: Gfo/Idh/MocA family oxidoreductase [Bacteroidales bacterium]|nr:Gfo/Idh/MocA family oxidoreductase [Bacteroidales bacterium]
MSDKKLNRRSFIKEVATTGVVAGFPVIVSSSALGRDGAVSPSSRLLMAQIGCGAMGSGNMRGFLGLNDPALQIISVCDVDSRHAAGGKKVVDGKYKTDACTTYTDYREMLEKEDLDCVSHALPDHWHAPVSIACARKGIDMYGEKPFARSIKEGRAMCDAIDRYNLIWQTGSWQRSRGDFHKAAELVRNGRIGKVEYVEVGLPDGRAEGGPQVCLEDAPDYIDWNLWLGPAPYRPFQNFNGKLMKNGGRGPHWDWRWILDYSGGQLTDWAGHHVDIAHWGLGLDRTGPVEIGGKGKYATGGIYDVPYAYDFVCKYANGVNIRVANRSVLLHGQGVCWYGDKGWIHVNRGGLKASDSKILREKIGAGETLLYKSYNHHKNFIDCVKSRKETITPAEVAHRSISVGLLGEIAMQTGRKLKWNPDKEEFIGDSGANNMLKRQYRSGWGI